MVLSEGGADPGIIDSGTAPRGTEGKLSVMPAITWAPAMSVGVEALDNDHKILIDLINQLDEAMATDDAYEIIYVIVAGLVDYTEYHFKREEGMMRACDYPAFANHCAEHRAIEQKIQGLKQSYDENIIGGFDLRLMDFMRGWLTDHILGRDMSYAPFMGRLGAGPST